MKVEFLCTPPCALSILRQTRLRRAVQSTGRLFARSFLRIPETHFLLFLDQLVWTPASAALPSALVEDIFTSIRRMLELQSVYLSVRSTQGFEQPPVACMDVELVASSCIAVMMASDFFRNVHMRCDG